MKRIYTLQSAAFVYAPGIVEWVKSLRGTSMFEDALNVLSSTWNIPSDDARALAEGLPYAVDEEGHLTFEVTK